LSYRAAGVQFGSSLVPARRRAVTRSLLRPLVGFVTLALVVVIFAVAAQLFRGGFTDSVPVTVISDRAGLVMNPDAKVQVRGVQVGKVAWIEELPNGQAAIHLSLDPTRLTAIPANALVEVASPTVFGAKQVQFLFPEDPSPDPLQAGQVIEAQHVMVEINTVFEQLTSVLSAVEPAKLNATLGGIASALNGRGEKIGQMLTDLDSFLARLEPSLPALSHDLEVAPDVLRAYGDAAPDFVSIADSATRISETLVDEQQNLDAALVSVIGLADIGNEVLGENRQPLTDVLRLLVPTTDLTNQYNQALWCALAGMVDLSHRPPLKEPGVAVIAGFLWGQERYRYPMDLPKAGAKGGRRHRNPWRRVYPGIILNSDLIKQIMFPDTEIDGPPRNTAQIGQPG
jgi:phospholipid/cholesterol/gamma-HCH transport system substrate-binding protein